MSSVSMRTPISTTSGSTSPADNIDDADRWIEKLFDAFEALGRTPGMGQRHEDLASHPVLFWLVGAYLLIYRDRAPSHRDHGDHAGSRVRHQTVQ